MPDAATLDRLRRADRVSIARLAYDTHIATDTLRVSETWAHGYRAIGWASLDAAAVGEVIRLLAEPSCWRGPHDVGWELSPAAPSHVAIRFHERGEVLEVLLFLDWQCIEAWGSRACLGRGQCGVTRDLLAWVKKALPNDPDVQSMQNLGPESEE